MELMMDWRSFQNVFYPHEKMTSKQNAVTAVVADQGQVISAARAGDDLTDWRGAPLAEVRSSYPDRKMSVIQRSDLNRVLSEAREKSHYYDQIEHLRNQLLSQDLAQQSPHHFLLKALAGWWQKFLPGLFGMGLQLQGEDGANRVYVLMVRRGHIDAFHEPDLIHFELSGRKTPEELSKYLSERYLAPVVVASMPKSKWNEWSQDYNPWGEVIKAINKGEIQVFPRRFSHQAMMAAQTLF
jgi:hypothetical protein